MSRTMFMVDLMNAIPTKIAKFTRYNSKPYCEWNCRLLSPTRRRLRPAMLKL